MPQLRIESIPLHLSKVAQCIDWKSAPDDRLRAYKARSFPPHRGFEVQQCDCGL
jgi:hypothetical protein